MADVASDARVDLAWASAADIAAAVAAGRVRVGEVIEGALARIAVRNGALNAFTAVVAERARERARALDAARAAGKPLGPLAGVPFAVKNLFDVAGLPTLAGSKINRSHPAARRDATLIERLEAAGAVLVGALNMGEYAYDFTGENVHDGPSRNPHDMTRMTGGSSGGSGAAVAGGLVPVALGSDTNGSIRVPASLCGLFGLKPTYGRPSRARPFPFVGRLAHVGPRPRCGLRHYHCGRREPASRAPAHARQRLRPGGARSSDLGRAGASGARAARAEVPPLVSRACARIIRRRRRDPGAGDARPRARD